MPDSRPKKIVYLFGAGATHAELANLEKDPASEKFLKNKGLLITHVSDRVIEQARSNKKYIKDIEMVSSAQGSPNIELLISLIENSRVKYSEYKTSHIKELVRKDIEGKLTKAKKEKFYLHKALLEFHEHEKIKESEQLLGLISLNYDSVLDEAYKVIYKKSPNYSFSLNESRSTPYPLLKLHGSFNWRRKKIRGRIRNIQIIPLGVNKNYLHVPYNYIWNRALEILTECDILRVVGSKLSPNDIHLVDLLFKAHLEKGEAFEIQVIASKTTGEDVRDAYGFFPKIKNLAEIEPPLVPEDNPSNAFKMWLEYKGRQLSVKERKKTKYLKKVTGLTI